ncbi:MAG: hypothetical protein ACI9TH_005086 [Kiritimatiellia bacterium]|jgi:hypothetical protein
MRKSDSVIKGESSSGTDLMTALIGCLILIVCSILIVVFVTTVTVTTAEVHQNGIGFEYGQIDAFAQGRAFPDRAHSKEPIYIEVRLDGLTVYPQHLEITQEEAYRKDGPLYELLDQLKADDTDRFVILLVRPNAVVMQRFARTLIKDTYGMDIGIDYYESSQPIRAARHFVRSATP